MRAILGQPTGEHPECNELEIDVELTLKTEDGLFEEQVSATLRARSATDVPT